MSITIRCGVRLQWSNFGKIHNFRVGGSFNNLVSLPCFIDKGHIYIKDKVSFPRSNWVKIKTQNP